MNRAGPRALDHIVLPCADLDEGGRAFEALGFLVGRRNRHPWGTENRIIQVPGAFIELIALAPDYAPLPVTDDAFPFAGFLAGQGASQAPSGMIVLRSEHAAADARAFEAAGIGTGRTLHFSRAGLAPDGSTRTVAFTVAFVDAPLMPDLGCFVCQQHNPENFWNPASQRHPNGVTGIDAVTITAACPEEQASLLSRFADQPDPVRRDGTVTIGLADGAALVIRPGAGAPRLSRIGFCGGSPRTVRFGTMDLVFAPAGAS